jgi:hypothetical protein
LNKKSLDGKVLEKRKRSQKEKKQYSPSENRTVAQEIQLCEK